jgi:ribosomal protein L32
MAVPKKRTSMSKKRIRRNIWIKKGSYLIAKKASYLSKFTSMINLDNVIKNKKQHVLNRKVFGFGFLSKNLFNQ